MNLSSYNSVSAIQYNNTPCIQVKNAKATALLSLFGGHLLSFIPGNINDDLLWLSTKAIFDEKTAIRGGVPICWPWFSNLRSGDGIPAHGFARSQAWTLQSITENSEAGAVCETILTLKPTTLGLYALPESLAITLVVSVGEKCTLRLVTENTSNTPISITQALHSYFNVKDITSAEIEGVTTDYYDKVSDTYGKKTSIPYKFDAETDRIHKAETSTSTNSQIITIKSHDNYNIKIGQSGHDSIIVWNPHIDKSMSMKDMSDSAYKTMLCIEAGNTKDTITEANSAFEISQWFSAELL